ncbi:MAG: 6-bladed beta-propeller [Bacteroidetes bacterium]|nr:MAG: 6-bladed beta-propeller [Bacteroidota bacterium]
MKLTYLLFLVIITFSSSSSDGNLYEVDPRNFVENKITLAEIADDISYIPLDNSFPIGNIYNYKILNSSIYLTTKEEGVMVFNRDGKFSGKIGSLGRGPGEYYYYMYFDINPKSKSVYLLDKNIIKVYAGSGQFQRSISLKEYGEFFEKINFFNEKLLISEYINMGEAKYSWLILDTTGILLKMKYNPIPAFNTNRGSGGGTYIFDDKIFYWELYNDTVYSVLPDLSYKASFLFSPGEHRWPKSLIIKGSISQMQSTISKYMNILSLFETKRFLVFVYSYKKNAIALIDKKSRKSFVTYVESFSQQRGGILNNLDGGIMFQPKSYLVENGWEYMIGLINPYQIKAHVASSEFKNSAPKYPEKKKELEKLANSLKETDNPVMMIVKLKK